jgi:hypothetical protein
VLASLARFDEVARRGKRLRSILLNTARRWGWCSLRSRNLSWHGGRAISDARSLFRS